MYTCMPTFIAATPCCCPAVVLTARDGLPLPAYLSLPPLPNVPNTLLPQSADSWSSSSGAWGFLSGLKLPLVLFVHGGPWARDSWGLDVTAQWFCNRGYAVLQVISSTVLTSCSLQSAHYLLHADIVRAANHTC